MGRVLFKNRNFLIHTIRMENCIPINYLSLASMSLNTFRKSKLQAWLLPIALVFSLFAFSGSATPTAARRAFATEQIASVRVSDQRQASFQIKRDRLSFHAVPAPSFLQALRYYELTVKIQIIQHANRLIVFPEFMRYASPYTLRCSEEDSILLA
jgi:hypothetical protein